MKVEFEVLKGNEVAQRLLGLLGAVASEGHSDDCLCIECTAGRMAQAEEPGKAASDEVMPEVTKRHLLAVAKRADRAQENCAQLCARIVERPTRPELDDLLYQWRVDQYNLHVRYMRLLFEMAPAEFKAEVTAPLPEQITWERAVERLQEIRGEIAEAITQAKIAESLGDVGQEAANTFGAELAKLMKAAIANGRPKAEVEALIRSAGERAKDSMREGAPAEAS